MKDLYVYNLYNVLRMLTTQAYIVADPGTDLSAAIGMAEEFLKGGLPLEYDRPEKDDAYSTT